MNLNTSREWLEVDGLGGFASGTSTGIRTRRYHALLLTATTPPTGRMVLVNGLDAWVETPGGRLSLSSQYYAPGVVDGEGGMRIESFEWDPWPRWVFKLEDGTRIEHEIFVPKGRPATCISWKLLNPGKEVKLFVRPFLSGRDYHALHKSNSSFSFDAEIKPKHITWRPYGGTPPICAISNGEYAHQPVWYYNFLYEEERNRGLDCTEDLAAPGVLCWNLAKENAALVLTAEQHAAEGDQLGVDPLKLISQFRDG